MKRNDYFEHDLDHDCNNVGTTIESAEADTDRIALHSIEWLAPSDSGRLTIDS